MAKQERIAKRWAANASCRRSSPRRLDQRLPPLLATLAGLALAWPPAPCTGAVPAPAPLPGQPGAQAPARKLGWWWAVHGCFASRVQSFPSAHLLQNVMQATWKSRQGVAQWPAEIMRKAAARRVAHKMCLLHVNSGLRPAASSVMLHRTLLSGALRGAHKGPRIIRATAPSDASMETAAQELQKRLPMLPLTGRRWTAGPASKRLDQLLGPQCCSGRR